LSRPSRGKSAPAGTAGSGEQAGEDDDPLSHAGISRRSYFRYFASKDAALAEGLAAVGRSIAEALAQRPAHESPWEALRRTFDPLIEQAETDPGTRDLARLMVERPALQYGKNTVWQEAIAATLESRLTAGGSETRFRAEAVSAAAIACLHMAQAHWLRPENSARLADLLDSAMSAVHPLA
jgi:AcrR family transcriptional regulator